MGLVGAGPPVGLWLSASLAIATNPANSRSSRIFLIMAFELSSLCFARLLVVPTVLVPRLLPGSATLEALASAQRGWSLACCGPREDPGTE